MEDKINIKAITLNDPAKREKGTGFKKAKKIMEDKVFEGGKKDKNIMAPNTANKDIMHQKKW